MVEYIDQQIKNLSWQLTNKSSDVTSSETCGDCIISGSKTHISVWQFVDEPGIYDQLPIAEIASHIIPFEACKVHLIGNVAFTATRDGVVYLHELVTERDHRKYLRPISETKNLHVNYKCNDMSFCAQTNSVLTCGDDGSIASFNIERPNKVISKQVIETSLRCMDMITPHEVICGTLSGALKHIDLRSYQCIGTFRSQSLSTLNCIQRNPNVNHLAASGNDMGSIMIYDLRNPSISVTQVTAHNAPVTSLRYRPKDPSTLYSSSCDGELFRWNMGADFTANQTALNVESISRMKEPLSITSLDINHLGDMVYASDHGAIYYQKLNELGA